MYKDSIFWRVEIIASMVYGIVGNSWDKLVYGGTIQMLRVFVKSKF